MAEAPKIRLSKNGPLVVTGLEDFTDETGEPLPLRDTVRLCRCGASSTKPFCDGTHASIGFTDTPSSSRLPDRRDDYVGDDITIHDNRGICSHAGYCTAGLPVVWGFNEPWIDPNGASTEQIVSIIRKCPSGALSYSINDVEHRDVDRPPAIALTKDGPYRVGAVSNSKTAPGSKAPPRSTTRCADVEHRRTSRSVTVRTGTSTSKKARAKRRSPNNQRLGTASQDSTSSQTAK